MKNLLEGHGYIIVQAPLQDDIVSYRHDRVIIFNSNLTAAEYEACLCKVAASLIASPFTRLYTEEAREVPKQKRSIASIKGIAR